MLRWRSDVWCVGLSALLFLVALPGCDERPAKLPAAAADPVAVRVAFMPDVHFHDIHARFSDGAFPGLPPLTPGGEPATIRTMAAQLSSTRLFNENYFALRAALDDAVARGIRIIALPGDFSDDGQPIHLRGLHRLLDLYERQYGVRFFLTPGNHDPVRPVDQPSGKPDFLGSDGRRQPLYSPGTAACPADGGVPPDAAGDDPLPVICTPEIRSLGYAGILAELGGFGFEPRPDDLHWETPYSAKGPYSYAAAREAAMPDARQYEICREGTGGAYRKPGYTDCRMVPDASYLVEPVAGLWLLAIDANVYRPRDGGSFAGSGDAGYNRVLTHKAQLIDWVRDVAARARTQGKTLVTFSHFPMVEFLNGTGAQVQALFGPKALQQERLPADATSRALAAAGVRVHVGGHMHYNDTGVRRFGPGEFLVNIQAPSLAGYVPAYKILTFSPGAVEVETPVLADVPGFDSLFPYYRQEHRHLQAVHSPELWDEAILSSPDYRSFTRDHLRQLAQRRFFPKDWPADLRAALLDASGRDLWQRAGGGALADAALLDGWTGLDLALDFHRLANAGDLALPDVPAARLAAYRRLEQALDRTPPADPALAALLRERLARLLAVVDGLSQGAPSDHFRIDMTIGALEALPPG
ncbi:metallophosphoesterase family protein [Oleisolibacter albus]|uniref:metallophosphoesterase family protein n=1 Tax=Oleisolibacter albus TaxID=2171757 RepID=UPI000DF2FEFB|nr:metallophosphoesterase [Oleisolibacter albus]